METTKTTVNLPSSRVYQAKLLAVKNQVTLTHLLTKALELIVENKRDATISKPRSLGEFLETLSATKFLTENERQKIYETHLKQKYG